MPKPSNDAIVRRHAELRATLIQKCSMSAAEKILRIPAKKLSIATIAEIIAAELQASAI